MRLHPVAVGLGSFPENLALLFPTSKLCSISSRRSICMGMCRRTSRETETLNREGISRQTTVARIFSGRYANPHRGRNERGMGRTSRALDPLHAPRNGEPPSTEISSGNTSAIPSSRLRGAFEVASPGSCVSKPSSSPTWLARSAPLRRKHFGFLTPNGCSRRGCLT
jgi:hypothetical protein